MSQLCKLKICGLSRFADIDAVNETKPDYVGFVFAESSRKVSPDKAAQLKRELDPGIKAVGVFVNAPIDQVLAVCDAGREETVDLIQLHGDEDENYIRKLKQYTSKPIIKAVGVRSEKQIQEALGLSCDYLLLDTFVKSGYGGSGKQFDWGMIPKLSKPWFLAGGIHVGNLERALKCHPFCIDVSSSLEIEGRKDKNKIKELTEHFNRLCYKTEQRGV